MKPPNRFVNNKPSQLTPREIHEKPLAKRGFLGIVVHVTPMTRLKYERQKTKGTKNTPMRQIIVKFTPMFLTCLIAGTALTILAPYGTQSFPFIYRLLYWVGLTLAGGIGAACVDVFSLLRKKELNNWLHALAQSIMASLAVFIVLVVMMKNTYGLPRPASLMVLFFYIWVISAIITSVGAIMRSKKQDADTQTEKRAAIYERLPPHLRSAEIYALAAEDHYVRIITSRGDELVLMRLGDAIKETAPLNGLSPHRSWWVAETGIDKVKKSEIILHSEQVVPISRSGMKLVREAGWK